MREVAIVSDPDEHLSDADIDSYWRDALPEADVARVEQHYLDCAACRIRVERVEDLVRTLGGAPRDVPQSRYLYWPGAAAALAASVLAGWMAHGWTRDRVTGASPDARSSTIARVNRAAEGPVVTVTLAPPTRGSEMAMARAPESGVVVFVLDAREAAAPGSRASVTLAAADRRTLLTLTDVATAADGAVRVPLDAPVVPPGRYVFEVTGPSGHASIPFVVERQ
jgi:hypothetical protein